MAETPEPQPNFPRMAAPEVPLPKKTIPGSIGCMTAFLLALALIGLAVAYFYSLADYTTSLNVDGTYRFSGTLAGVKKVFFVERYKLVIAAPDGDRVTLPPVPSPIVDGKPLFKTIKLGLCVDGDVTSKEGFLHDLAIKIGEQSYHYDTAAGWLVVAPTPPPPAATPVPPTAPTPLSSPAATPAQ